MIFVDKECGVVRTEEKFAYTNKTGNVEYVKAVKDEGSVDLFDFDDDRLNQIYYEDIPKLILALQAAYDFKFKEAK